MMTQRRDCIESSFLSVYLVIIKWIQITLAINTVPFTAKAMNGTMI